MIRSEDLRGAAAFPAKAPVISFEGVSKTFAASALAKPVRAVETISFDVERGDIFGVIGRSGAGKSTLIRLVNGLERATRGRILVEGYEISGLSEHQLIEPRRKIGMIFQHFNLLSGRTVAQNVALPLEIAGTGKADIRRRVAELLDLVGLVDKSQRYPAELSGGQKQRVGIARALASKPSILLSDEATSALDPETTASILELLGSVNRELGLTIVLITHEIPVVQAICNRVAVLEAGRIVEQGSVQDMFLRPQHPTTRSFVSAVTGLELPAPLQRELREVPGANGKAILELVLSGANASGLVLSRLSSLAGVDINIIAGRVGTIAGAPFGALLVAVPANEVVLKAILGALSELKQEGRVLGYVD